MMSQVARAVAYGNRPFGTLLHGNAQLASLTAPRDGVQIRRSDVLLVGFGFSPVPLLRELDLSGVSYDPERFDLLDKERMNPHLPGA